MVIAKKGGYVMETDSKMEKYLNKKSTYKPVDTIDNVFKKALDKSKQDTAKYKKKIDKLLIRDAEGNVHEMTDVLIIESEDGAGTMTYTAMHPHGGRGRQGHNKGLKCPHCGKTIDLRR
jgi:ElaB/YqjD/DUF883 family membrane-anchored ribosome-binding protein